MGWVKTSKELPELDALYWITDRKVIALAKWDIGNMWWKYLYHTSVFEPTHMLKITLPMIDVEH